MPKNLITIKDATDEPISLSTVKTVYIPGPSSTTYNEQSIKQVLCRTTAELDRGMSENGWTTSLSYKLATYLILRYGFYVVYEGIGSNTSVPSTSWEALKYSDYDIDFITTGQFGGADTGAAACAEYRKDCIYLVDHIEDISLTTDYKVLKEEPSDWSSGTYAGEGYYYDGSADTYTQVGNNYRAWEPYTFYYILPTIEEQTVTDITYILTKSEPQDWNETFNLYYIKDPFNPQAIAEATPFVAGKYYKKITATGGNDYVQLIRSAFSSVSNSEYSAAFTPWFKSTVIDYTSNDGGYIQDSIPASFGYLFAYANSIRNNPVWLAVAGPERGNIPELLSVDYSYSRRDVEVLQARAADGAVDLDATGDNVGFAINPIAYIRPFGTIIYGNRTLLINPGTLKASSFLNIRNLVSLIARTAYTAANRYKFDQNNSLLWNKFSSVLIPVLDSAVSGGGILGYSLTQVKTKKKARLQAQLTIVPIEAVEDLDLLITLTDSLEVSVE